MKPLLDIQITSHRIEDYLITHTKLIDKLIKINNISETQHTANMRFMKSIILILLGVILLFAGKDLGAYSALCKLFGF